MTATRGRQFRERSTSGYLRNLARLLDVRTTNGADFRHWVLNIPVINKRWAIVLIRETKHADSGSQDGAR